jgi:hypothetical protein
MVGAELVGQYLHVRFGGMPAKRIGAVDEQLGSLGEHVGESIGEHGAASFEERIAADGDHSLKPP